MQTVPIDAVFMRAQLGKYTSKKTGKVVEYTEVVLLIDNVVAKFAFKQLSKDFDIKDLDCQAGDNVKAHVYVTGNMYDHDNAIVVLDSIS